MVVLVTAGWEQLGSSDRGSDLHAGVAQLVEQLSRKQLVAGSSPVTCSEDCTANREE